MQVHIKFLSPYASSTLRIDGVVLLENVRFNIGEAADDAALSAEYASLCDVFVMDAFGTAHRAQASTHGVVHSAPVACAGPLLHAELTALERALTGAQKPMLAVVGGSKVSTKLEVLDQLSRRCDSLVVGGGIANTFMAAAGLPIGKSLAEKDLVDEARRILLKMGERGATVPIPVDVVVAKEFSASAEATVKKAADVAEDDMILDIGPETAQQLAKIMKDAGTIVWNGPLGVFEFEAFANGTKVLSEAIAESDAMSIAGGGDTVAALAEFGITDKGG